MVVRVRSATVTAAMGRLIEGGGERHRGAKHSTIHKKNVRRAVTRRAYRVLGQDRATIGGQICLRNPAVGAGAAIRGEGGQSARGVSRGGAGNPRLRGERKPTCSPLVTSFASGISSSRAVLAGGAAHGACRAACEAGMSAAVAPDLLGFHCGPMFAAGLPIRREAEVAPNFSR